MCSPYGLEWVPNCTACRLRAASFFCALPRPALRDLDSIKFSNILPKGSILFLAGEMPAGVHLLCEGRVGLSMQTATGRNILVKVVGAGEALGLHACIRRSAHELSATTLQPCQIGFVKGREFIRLLRRRGDVSCKTAQVLARASHEAHEVMRAVGVQRPACARLARLLLELITTGKPTGAPQYTVEIPFTGLEIAECMGMSRGTVRRTLFAFRHRQIVSLNGQSLIVHNRPALERMAAATNIQGAPACNVQSAGFWARLHPPQGRSPSRTAHEER